MSTCVANSLGLCVSFADADEQGMTKATSLRRTFSADMSSKTWSVETGFALRRLVPDVVDSADEADGRRVENDDTNRPSRPSQIDIWSSILSQKNDSHSAAPYVHPLVKRSGSLSKKSLEICTESLGSETGSDVFSSSPISDISGDELVKVDTEKSQPLRVEEAAEEVQVVKYNCSYHNKKSFGSGSRSFPPPLPSLARHEGASLHMHSHRENGRLVLAAVSIPTHNNFHAQRQDGRLLLTFVKENNSNLPEAIQKNDVMDKSEDDHKEDAASDEPEDGELKEALEAVNTKKNMTVEVPKVTAIGVIHVQSPTFIVNKVITLASRHTSIWTTKFNEVLKVELQAEEATDQLNPNSPPQPRLTTSLITSPPPSMTSATFNAYEYCWRRKPAPATTPVFNTTPSSAHISKNHNMFILTKAGKDSTHKNGDRMPTNFLVLKGKVGEGDFIVPYFKGCKNQKMSLMYREPYCIATS